MAKSTVDKSNKQTKFVGDVLGMHPTPRSGATLRSKGDLKDEFSLGECKTYMKEQESFTVKKEWLTKMQRERFEDRKQFAFLIINFGGAVSEDNHVVIDLESFEAMYKLYKERMGARDD